MAKVKCYLLQQKTTVARKNSGVAVLKGIMLICTSATKSGLLLGFSTTIVPGDHDSPSTVPPGMLICFLRRNILIDIDTKPGTCTFLDARKFSFLT